MSPKLLQALRHDLSEKKKLKGLRETKRVSRKATKLSSHTNSSLVNYTGTEYMELHGSTVIMASDDSSANPLTAIIVITSIFLFMTLSVTVAVLVFCRKKNAVFVLQKCEQEDEISYELDDMNNTDIEFADFEGEHEAMQPKARKSATCPDLLDSIEREDRQCLQLLLDHATESETDDSGKERSPVHPKLKRRSKSFTFQSSGYHGYQQMVVTAVMETRNTSKTLSSEVSENGYRSNTVDLYDKSQSAGSLPFRSEINLYPHLLTDDDKMQQHNNSAKRNDTENIVHRDFNRTNFVANHIADISSCFNDAKLAFIDSDSENETSQFIELPDPADAPKIQSNSDFEDTQYLNLQCHKTISGTRQSSIEYAAEKCTEAKEYPQTKRYSSIVNHQSNQSNPSSQDIVISNQSGCVLQKTEHSAMPVPNQRQHNHTTADFFDPTNKNTAYDFQMNAYVKEESDSVSHMNCDDKSDDLSPVTDQTGLLH